MLYWLTIILILITPACWAEDVSFQWDANTEPDLAGYRVYRSTTQGGPYLNVSGDILCGSNDGSCCHWTDAGVPDGIYYWIARAFDTEGFESENSVEQFKEVASGQLEAPANFRIITIPSGEVLDTDDDFVYDSDDLVIRNTE